MNSPLQPYRMKYSFRAEGEYSFVAVSFFGRAGKDTASLDWVGGETKGGGGTY